MQPDEPNMPGPQRRALAILQTGGGLVRANERGIAIYRPSTHDKGSKWNPIKGVQPFMKSTVDWLVEAGYAEESFGVVTLKRKSS